MAKRVLVTGGSGAVGYPLIKDLLANGVEVGVLARPKHTVEDLRKLYGRSVDVIHGDVVQKLCGVRASDVRSNVGYYDAVIHAAGLTQYHEEKRAETYATNVGGTENVLALASELEIPQFVYISTAYVGADRVRLKETDVMLESEGRNPYEQSKIKAEALVRDFPGSWLNLRLSTVIGHSESGFIVNAGGYAGFVKAFHSFRDRIMKYEKSPFLVGVNPASTLNLVSSDWTCEMIRKSTLAGCLGTMHLSHTTPVSMGWLFRETFQKHLKMPLTFDRTSFETSALYEDPIWMSTQERIAKVVDYFGPYVTHDTSYGHDLVRTIPGYRPPPEISSRVLGAQLRYMQEHLFVRRRLAPVKVA